MATPKASKKNHPIAPSRVLQLRFDLRFADAEHKQLCKDAAEAAKVSLNVWIVQATLAAARKQLAR